MLTFLLGVLASLVAAEIYLCLPALAKWIVRRYASKLPPDLAERMLPEWMAEVEACSGHGHKLLFAAGLFGGIDELLSAHRDGTKTRTTTRNPEPSHFTISGHAPTALIRSSSEFGSTVSAAVGTASGSSGATAFDAVVLHAAGTVRATSTVHPAHLSSLADPLLPFGAGQEQE